MKSLKLSTLKKYLTEADSKLLADISVVMANYSLHKSWPWGVISVTNRFDDVQPYGDVSTSSLAVHWRLPWENVAVADTVVVSADDFSKIQSAMFIA